MDIDAGVNGLVEYFLVEGTHNHSAASDMSHDGRQLATADGFGTFEIAYPHQGHVSSRSDDDDDRLTSTFLYSLFSHLFSSSTSRSASSRHWITNVFSAITSPLLHR